MTSITADFQDFDTSDVASNDPHKSYNALHSRIGRIGVLSHAARTMLGFVIIVISILPPFVLSAILEETNSFGGAMAAASILTLIGVCYGVWLSVVSTIKRLHDLSMTGWLYIPCMIPVIGTLFFLFVSIKRGSEKENKYGNQSTISSFEKNAGYAGMLVLLLIVAISLVSSASDLMAMAGV